MTASERRAWGAIVAGLALVLAVVLLSAAIRLGQSARAQTVESVKGGMTLAEDVL